MGVGHGTKVDRRLVIGEGRRVPR